MPRPEDNITTIDLDDCIRPDGTLTDFAERIVELYDSYTEITPSRVGLRVYIKGRPPGTSKKKGGIGPDGTDSIEFYADG